MTTKTLLTISCSFELASGVALIASPGIVASVLLAAELTPGGVAIARITGCGLFSLATACWPRGACLPHERDHEQPIRALFLYNLLAACYLGYLGISGDFASPFLLPVAVLQGLLALLFIRPVYQSVVGKAPSHPQNS
jgi:hypothetical protein